MPVTNGADTQGEQLTRPAAVESSVDEQARFVAVMAALRRRRKLFFAVVIGYMPFMWISNKFYPSFRGMAITFGIWFIVLFLTAFYSALARCPGCGQYFHMHGMSLLYMRRCLHCQLHISSKRKEDS